MSRPLFRLGVRYQVATVLLITTACYVAWSMSTKLRSSQPLTLLRAQHLLGTEGQRLPIGRRIGPCNTEPYVECNNGKVIPVSDLDLPAAFKAQRPHSWIHHMPLAETIVTATHSSEDATCCAFSDDYKFIYVKIAKSASSSILMGYLRPTICPPSLEEQRNWDSETRSLSYRLDCPNSQFQPLNSECYPCTSIPRHKWVNYFVFTAVRNPIQRAISSYRYCLKSEAAVSFADWCLNPYLGGGICGVGDMANIHLAAQTPWLCTRDGDCVVDYVAHVESLAEDMDAIVRQINFGRKPHVPDLPNFSASVKLNVYNQSKALPDLLSGDANCAHALNNWFAEDLRFLGYPPARK